MKYLIANYFKTRYGFYVYSPLVLLFICIGNYPAALCTYGILVYHVIDYLKDQVIKDHEYYIKELQKHIADLNKSKFTLNQ